MSSLGQALAHVMAVDRRTAAAVRALHAADVPALLLKGPAMAAAFYDADELRLYGDVDLLVPEERYDRAVEALLAAGWSRRFGGTRDSERSLGGDDLVFPDGLPHPDDAGGVCLDLHRTFHRLHRSAEVWPVLARGAGELRVGGAAVPVPARSVQCLIAALHATRNVAGSRSHEDLTRAVGRAIVAEWSDAVAVADELGARGALAEGLRLVPGGEELLEVLGLSRVVDVDVRRTLAGSPALAIAAVQLRQQPGARATLRLLSSKAVPTPAALRSWQAARGWSLPLPLAYPVRLLVLAGEAAALAGRWAARRVRRTISRSA